MISNQRPQHNEKRWEPWTDLTPREREVLALLSQGLSGGEIASALGISRWTVRQYTDTIVRKLGARNRTHAACLAVVREMILPQQPPARSYASGD